ncbi:hypothetical protein [Herbiconiux sp. VKM Ac-2851]|uniref:hypothetical protein n=1 Tax=Herbiconiux sp. VKM Ac-2851 TaxID=2739025 RepID=UPI001566255E|nr:hypothetical protein [Herbiconiux sp. VKM Ac-2851]NQX37193.1 hypothetical protein [Herbiconiux sp. VKM Ac-2851]
MNMPAPIRTPCGIWGLRYPAPNTSTVSARDGLTLFAPGTTRAAAHRLICYYRWVDHIGVRVFAVLLPLFFIAAYHYEDVSPLGAMAVGAALDILLFVGVSALLRLGKPRGVAVRQLATVERVDALGERVLIAGAIHIANAGTMDAIEDETLWGLAWDAAEISAAHPNSK